MKNYNWLETDKQFVEALLLATGGEDDTSLQDVLLMADAADGTVFELKEVEEALLKLIAVKAVTIVKSKLSISPAFLQQYEALTLQEGLTENDNLLLDLLQQQILTDEGIDFAKETLKPFKLKNKYQAYQEQFGE